jgi:predicted small secreted protein
MTMKAIIVLAVPLLALTLAGCSTSGEGVSGAGRAFVAPDKFVLYNCPQIEVKAQGTVARRKQLDQLMAKAGTTPDGRLVSLLAYQSEYTENGADLAELRRSASDKNCPPIAALAQPAAR